MKLINGIYERGEELAVETPQGVFRVASLMRAGAGEPPLTMDDLLRDGEASIATLRAFLAQAVQAGLKPDGPPRLWLPPLTHPGKIVCVGLNYRPHARESGFELPESPVLFNKFPNALVGQQATVAAPREARQFDYEAELVVVMGRTARRVDEAEALEYVLGYCNGNDLSARDLQFLTPQWLLGKACDGFGPLGPYLVTKDEIPDPDCLHIETRRNGVVVQNANTQEMIFSCRYLIAYISRFMTLEPGDVIFTGTPEGVILGYPEAEQRWLEPGETVAVSVTGLGELVTHIGEPDGFGE